MEEKFFGNHRSNDPTEVAFVEFLKRVNEKENFVEKTVMQIGYPRWDKTFIKPKNLPNLQQSLTGDSTEHYYIPFVRDSQNFVNAAMIITATPTDTSFSYRVDCDYRQLANSTTSVYDDAEYLAIFFMFMDKRVFGYHKFAIKDSNLFKENGNKATKIELTAAAANPTNGNLWDYVEFCQNVNISLTNCPSDPGQCSGIGGSCDNCPQYCTTIISYTYCWWDWVGTGGGGSGGTTTTGGGGSGGSPTPPSSCQGGGGTIPSNEDPVFVPYVCNYQLNQREQDVFNQLDEEDDQSDLSHQNLDCKGTKRTGNIFFQGTKEHWMIQLDYVSKNPINGDVEFAIPNSSPSGNRGYADVVNLQDKTIFEIKPDNLDGQTSGSIEVANYVLKANLYCSTTIPIGIQWTSGLNFPTVLLPTSITGRYLKAELHAPGVIVYKYERLANPSPVLPTAVPSTIVGKFKHLIDRLKQNFSQADKIIAEYLQQNPDLLTYIKTAAIGAGVAIVVGTILEDIITAGAGIADDWACFVLSYRIIRFALTL
jgi:hypothetical protein